MGRQWLPGAQPVPARREAAMARVVVVSECRLAGELVARVVGRDLEVAVAAVVLDGAAPQPEGAAEALAGAELVIYVPKGPVEALPWRAEGAGASNASRMMVVDLIGHVPLGQTLRLGARGYVGPRDPLVALAPRVLQLLRGEPAVPVELMAELDAAVRRLARERYGLRRLSEGQMRIACWVAQGWEAKEIARKLGISERAAYSRIRRVVERLGLRNEKELAALVGAAGLYSPAEEGAS